MDSIVRTTLANERVIDDAKSIRDTYFSGKRKENQFHTLNPGPTRLADPYRFRGARPYTRTLYLFFFFFKVELVPVGMTHIL